MRVVIDSNVVVSAMLTPHAPPAQVVRLTLQGDLGLFHDDRILAEYREVLLRPKFGFDAEDVRAMLEGIEWIGETVFANPLSVELPDPDDLPFLEVAAAAAADALVTGMPATIARLPHDRFASRTSLPPVTTRYIVSSSGLW